MQERVRTAEVIAALSLATDFGMGLPVGHGLESTLLALRLAERLDTDAETASQTYYACLLFYIGCTSDAELAAEIFDGDLHAAFTPVMFGSRGASGSSAAWARSGSSTASTGMRRSTS